MAIKTQQRGRIGYLTLDKPTALNALTLDMIEQLATGLQHFEAEDTVEAIVINSTSARAFCAGGDMKRIRQLALENDTATIEAFFDNEYALNLAIANCSKPYIALIDGVAMGGGLGLSIHGSYRVVTERAMLAMPESRIGFFPDVGGSYFLPRLVDNAGLWFALTAAPVHGDEAVTIGLGTHFVTSDKLNSLMSDLETQNDASIDEILDRWSTNVNNPEFKLTLENRSHCFKGHSANAIRTSLQQATADNEDAANLLKLLDDASPYSINTTLKLFASTHGLSLKECLAYEKTASMEAAFHPDFIEGVRALLIDKDKKPAWQPG